MSKRFRALHELPLFASEENIAGALMGPGQIRHWKQVAALLEGRGFPKIDALMGGRYTPAIKQFFDDEYRLNGAGQQFIASRDGPEALGTWKKQRGRQA